MLNQAFNIIITTQFRTRLVLCKINTLSNDIFPQCRDIYLTIYSISYLTSMSDLKLDLDVLLERAGPIGPWSSTAVNVLTLDPPSESYS